MPDELRLDYLPLAEIERWPRNPKKHEVATIEKSMARFGFVAPLVLDESTGRIVAGHGRLDALIKLRDAGAPPPKRIQLDENGGWMVPVVSGIAFTNEREAEAYLLADNRLVELGGWDDQGLAVMLSDLAAQGPALLEGVGWDQSDLAALAAYSSLDPPVEPVTVSPDAETVRTVPPSISVVCENMEQVASVMKLLGLPADALHRRKFRFSECQQVTT